MRSVPPGSDGFCFCLSGGGGGGRGVAALPKGWCYGLPGSVSLPAGVASTW